VFFSAVFLAFFLSVMQMSNCYYIKLSIEKLIAESLGEESNLSIFELKDHADVIDFYRKTIDRLFADKEIEIGRQKIFAKFIHHETYFGYMRMNNNFA